MKHTLGISEMRVTTSPEDILITYSLGSCVGLTLYDPVAVVGGMIHCMLPLSRTDPAKADANPAMFTDTGVSALIQEMYNAGATKKNLVARVAGASRIMDDKDMFKIGERNHTVLRKVLWKNGILIKSEDVGGTIARTMVLYMEDGRTTLSINSNEEAMA